MCEVAPGDIMLSFRDTRIVENVTKLQVAECTQGLFGAF